MSDKTDIEWCSTVNPDGSVTKGSTWNPVTGCTKVSPGCAHCYIERTPAFRINHRKFVRGTTDVLCHENRLEQPLHWRKPRRIFVNSLSDLFHEQVSNEFIAEVFHVMYGEASTEPTPPHIYQVLTKRPQRMLEWFDWLLNYDGDDAMIAALSLYLQVEGPHKRVWLGVSVENQHFADERIPLLLQAPAHVHWISAEPLLEHIDILQYLDHECGDPPHGACPTQLDWVVVGGESGPRARTFSMQWAREIVEQCKWARVPCFVKQMGSNVVTGEVVCDDETESYPVRCEFKDKKGGDIIEWPVHLRVRQFPR